MITFSALGRYGRLGNQLFQIAATIGVATKNGEQYMFPEWEYAKNINVPTYPLEDLKLFKWYQQPESAFTFCSEVFNIPRDQHVDLVGYFQSEKYFGHCKGRVRDVILTGKNLIHREELLKLHNIKIGSNVCAIHVRLGDYVSLPDHYVTLIRTWYYEQAIMRMRELGVDTFIVISDNIPFCALTLNNKPGFMFSNCTNPFDDLLLMSGCSHHIIANSSFSWWGSWLANSKKVIAPASWFGSAITHDTKDLYRKEMERM